MTFLYIAFLLLIAGAILATATSRHKQVCSWASLCFVSATSICLIYLAIHVFVKGPIEDVELISLRPLIGASLSLGIDALSALLLFIISIISFSATLFSIRYITRYQRESLLRYYPPLLLFFASLIGVVVVRDMLFFIFFWEIMSLTSWVLVVYETENKVSFKAGLTYFIVTHIATLCGILIASVLLYGHAPGPSFGFEALRASFETLLITNPALVHIILALFFIGFVTKAGVLPFGFWLPDAYPAAPTSATGAFAGTMTKLGVYGVVLIFGTILPISTYSQIWGIIIAAFGTFSIFIGTMAALTQDDSKRLFSFSIIGQIGYMFLGIGAGLYFLRINPALATIAFISGVFHLLNDALYKSCLFLNAGSILYKAGAVDLNKIGGLLGIMPFTGMSAIIASLALAGIPPLSGFASKLLIFESSIIAGAETAAAMWARALFVILGIAALFISAVTLAYVLKFLNSAFFGKLRGVEGIFSDVPLSMKIPQGILAFFCILFGVVPLLPITMVYKAVSGALPAGVCPALPTLFGEAWPGISVNFGLGMISGVWNPAWIIVAFILVLGLIYFVIRAGGAKVRQVETWYGGREHIAEDVAYRGYSFYMPFKQIFFFRARNIQFQGLYPTSFPLPRVKMPKVLRVLLHPDQWFYYPISSLFMKVNQFFSRSHTGHPQMYLLWIIIGAILVMVIILFL